SEALRDGRPGSRGPGDRGHGRNHHRLRRSGAEQGADLADQLGVGDRGEAGVLFGGREVGDFVIQGLDFGPALGGHGEKRSYLPKVITRNENLFLPCFQELTKTGWGVKAGRGVRVWPGQRNRYRLAGFRWYPLCLLRRAATA